ncbi:hypothetical protein FBUS_10514 [Fasciolopsis buskii]|uniref:Uncharacterized protein n=1 Tax=Fasciolopsis buskii TaxID=27845 RepID=A0A8E0RMG7_9TREM|nr:hypothetical protein FBUS_10514 [Fasciolopsis buski]
MSLSPHLDPELIRQQLKQQVRSALNLSEPALLSGPLGNSTNAGAFVGDSPLGQPLPPLLNSSNILPAHVFSLNQPTAGSLSNSFAHGHNWTGGNDVTFPNNIPNPSLPNGRLNNQNERYACQTFIFADLQELQKKCHAIEQQVCMYKNNPAISTQPQFADVFSELQGQLQQIGARLRTKMAQLNLASAQDSTPSATTGQSKPILWTNSWLEINLEYRRTKLFSSLWKCS